MRKVIAVEEGRYNAMFDLVMKECPHPRPGFLASWDSHQPHRAVRPGLSPHSRPLKALEVCGGPSPSLLGSQVNKPDPRTADMASPSSGDSSKASLLPPPIPPGLTVSQEIRFPDIYGGDTQLWEAHFRGIGRAYRALGKEDDFTIRVLTEDFTLPFPFAWPPGPDPANGPLFYDPHDRTGFDFLLRGPGAPPPALLRPLHSTAQAALRKRRLERLALSYAQAGAGQRPGLVFLAPGPTASTAINGPAGSDSATPSGGTPRLG